MCFNGTPQYIKAIVNFITSLRCLYEWTNAYVTTILFPYQERWPLYGNLRKGSFNVFRSGEEAKILCRYYLILLCSFTFFSTAKLSSFAESDSLTHPEKNPSLVGGIVATGKECKIAPTQEVFSGKNSDSEEVTIYWSPMWSKWSP